MSRRAVDVLMKINRAALRAPSFGKLARFGDTVRSAQRQSWHDPERRRDSDSDEPREESGFHDEAEVNLPADESASQS
jgi:hypothetical protein